MIYLKGEIKVSGHKIELKKGDTFSLKHPSRHKLGDYKIVWEPAEHDTPKDSVTTDWSKYIKENKK